MQDVEALAEVLVAGAKQYVDDALLVLTTRIAALEVRTPAGFAGALRSQDGHLIVSLADGRLVDVGPIAGKRGPGVDPIVLAELVRTAVADLTARQAPPDMPDLGVIAASVMPGLEAAMRDMVAAAFDVLAPPAPGKDADPEMLREAVVAEVTRQMAAQPAPRDGVDGNDGADGKDGRDGSDGKNADPEVMQAAIVAEVGLQVAALRVPIDGKDGASGRDGRDGIDGKDADSEAMQAAIVAEVDHRVAALRVPIDGKDGASGRDGRDGIDGKDADSEAMQAAIVAEVDHRVAALPAPADGKDGASGRDGRDGTDGKDADPEAMRAAIVAEVGLQVAALPAPVDGKDGASGRDGRDGIDGKDVDPGAMQAAIMAEVGHQVAALPAPVDGKDGASGTDGRAGIDGKDGESGLPGKDGADGKDGHSGADGKDGSGLADAFIDRDGVLVVTFSNGETKSVGSVVGRDADMDALAAVIVAEIAKMPRPRDGIDGRDGLGFDDLEVVHDGERALILRFTRDGVVREFVLTIPAIIDRGVWREGRFAKGDGVTWRGSFFIAQCDTEAQPTASKDWRQAVKEGRPGRNTETVKYLPATAKLPKPPGNPE